MNDQVQAGVGGQQKMDVDVTDEKRAQLTADEKGAQPTADMKSGLSAG